MSGNCFQIQTNNIFEQNIIFLSPCNANSLNFNRYKVHTVALSAITLAGDKINKKKLSNGLGCQLPRGHTIEAPPTRPSTNFFRKLM